MLALLVAGILLALCSRAAGNAILGRSTPDDSALDCLVIEVWAGLLAISATLLLVSLFMPLMPAAPILIAGGAVFGLRRPTRLRRAEVVALLLVATAVSWVDPPQSDCKIQACIMHK